MCEFCTKHGEGRKWYLEAKNYSDELLHAPLTSEEREASGATTRAEYLAAFCEHFVRPAATGEPKPLLEVGMALAPGAVRRALAHDRAGAFENHKTAHFGQVVSLEDAERVLEMVDVIVRMPCGCRYFSTGKTDKRYCFGVGIDLTGLLQEKAGSGAFEVLSRAEAVRIIRDYDTEGLVHTIWTGVTPFVIGLCNCDHDCMAYRGYIEERGAPGFLRGESVADIDPDLCSGCKECIKQCQFGAEFYSSALGKVYIDPTRCFGCGVCRAACPTDAIRLSPRAAHPQAAEIWLSYP